MMFADEVIRHSNEWQLLEIDEAHGGSDERHVTRDKKNPPRRRSPNRELAVRVHHDLPLHSLHH